MLINPRVTSHLLALLFSILAVSCGGGGGSSGAAPDRSQQPGSSPEPEPAPDTDPEPAPEPDPATESGPDTTYRAGTFKPAADFAAHCEAPRTGTNPDGDPWPDVQGSVLTENHWLRSWSHETYLWYDEIPDRDPADYDDPVKYFATLKTTAITPAGTPKDRFHYSQDTEQFNRIAQTGISVGYGMEVTILDATAPDRTVVINHTQEDSPTGDLRRGTRILEADGIDVATADTPEQINLIKQALSPDTVGESHEFLFEDRQGKQLRRALVAEELDIQPVERLRVFGTNRGEAGYMLFTQHIAAAELALGNGIMTLQSMADGSLEDLIVDMRFNGGGYLSIASQLSYMIAGRTRTRDRIFERQRLNSKLQGSHPVSGKPLSPLPFISETIGFSASPGQPLPSLDLERVYILTSGNTCSASESIINSLRGIGVEVIQIGSTTCGKPYGFFPTDNCGTTYFTIQFQGVNDIGFGDYGNGFTPQNSRRQQGVNIPGCAVQDHPVDNEPLGSKSEWLLESALHYINTGTCLHDPPEAQPLSSLSVSPANIDEATQQAVRFEIRKPFPATNRILTPRP